ncbi:Dipeptidase [Mycena kentingensis (nom. inval.)]|nr:Dipeptidase [Mycena kentingensis (nom. inval.)]
MADEERVARRQTPDETTTLLPTVNASDEYYPMTKTRAAVWAVLTLVFVTCLTILVAAPQIVPDFLAPAIGRLPKDPLRAAKLILDSAPIIVRLSFCSKKFGAQPLRTATLVRLDGPSLARAYLDIRSDLPILLRELFSNNLTAVDLRKSGFPGHVDIPRLRKGKVGGFFWSTYVDCANPDEEGPDFLNSTWRVRDTLEQIDVAKLAIEQYSDVRALSADLSLLMRSQVFQFATSSADIRASVANGKIASLLGIEGGHQLGLSIAVLRQYFRLGVRYLTLTHTCHNAFADSCGYAPGKEPLHGGLSPLGLRLIDEMNRLGMLVDLSHVADDTAKQALQHSRAPVIWSHSSARAVHNVPRNVPDDVLAFVGDREGQTDAVVMVNFAPQFVADEGKADVAAVADHVDHIAKVAGKKHVGIGSDYDGIGSTPNGLEDVSKYPYLFAELYRRGWNKHELTGLAGANLLRIFEGAEQVARELQAARDTPSVRCLRQAHRPVD